jgi:hypothetical protein
VLTAFQQQIPKKKFKNTKNLKFSKLMEILHYAIATFRMIEKGIAPFGMTRKVKHAGRLNRITMPIDDTGC